MMNQSDAAAILKVDASASEQEILRAYRALFTEDQRGLTNAPTPSIRTRYENNLRDLQSARDVMLASVQNLPGKKQSISGIQAVETATITHTNIIGPGPNSNVQPETEKPEKRLSVYIWRLVAIAMLLPVFVWLARTAINSSGGNQGDPPAADTSAAMAAAPGDTSIRNPQFPFELSDVSVMTGAQVLTGVWGTSASNVWAVGDSGTILHYDGTTWSRVRTTRGLALNRVWGASASDVWAAGYTTRVSGGRILHYDGSAWSRVFSSERNISGLWGTSATNVWAAGTDELFHYDGTSWSSAWAGSTLNELNDVWGASSSIVWAVGDNGTILQYDGATWSSVSSGANEQLHAIWGSSESDVWAVGKHGTILHYNGTTWQRVPHSTTEDINGVWGTSASDVWAVGSNRDHSGVILHYDGATWAIVWRDTSWNLYGVWGISSSDVWAVGGDIFHGRPTS